MKVIHSLLVDKKVMPLLPIYRIHPIYRIQLKHWWCFNSVIYQRREYVRKEHAGLEETFQTGNCIRAVSLHVCLAAGWLELHTQEGRWASHLGWQVACSHLE